METSILKLVTMMFVIWVLYKLASCIFRIVRTNQCDCCGKEVIPFVDKSYIVCDKCINNHSE